MPRISVVIPVYKAEKYLQELYDRLKASLETVSEDFEIILVEDGSPDASWNMIAGLARQDPRVKGLHFSRNFGQHPAIAAGFERATGDYVVLMDCDLQDRPEDIPRLIAKLQESGVDIVYTIKEGDLGAWHVRMTSKLYHFIFSKMAGVSVPESIGTFRVFTKQVLDAVLLYGERNVLYGPLMFFVGFESINVPVSHEHRQQGASTYSFRKRMTLAVNSLISYTDLPHRILMYLGMAALTGSIAYTFAVIVGYLWVGRVLVAGLTLIVVILTGFVGIVMLSLGIIGSYVFRVYQEVLRRPRYIVSRTANLGGTTKDDYRSN